MSRSNQITTEYEEREEKQSNPDFFSTRPDESDEAAIALFDLEDELEDNFARRESMDKHMQLRLKELKKLEGQKRKDYGELLEQELELVRTVSSLKESRSPHLSVQSSEYQKADQEYRNCVSLTVKKLKILTLKVLESPPKSVKKEIDLLNSVATNIRAFSVDPSKDNLKYMMESCKLVNTKMGAPWRNLKAAITMLVGAACIVVGVLGLVSTFGVSTGLIALGSMLCIASGLSPLKPFTSKKTLAANDASKEIKELLAAGSKLVKLDEAHLLNNKTNKDQDMEASHSSTSRYEAI